RIVGDDVDLLAAQLLHDRLHARSLHADAGADRIDVAIARADRDLRARPRLARRRLDAHDLLVDLRDLHLEQLLEQALVRARQDDLRAARGLVDVDDERDDAVTGAVRLARDLIAHRQHRLGAAQVDDDVAALEAPHDAGDQLALAVLVLVEDVLALRLAHALQDDLLGRLGGDAAESLPGAIQLQELAVLRVLLLGLRLVLLVVENLKQQLVAHLGLEAVAGGVLQRHFLAARPFEDRGHDAAHRRHVRHRLEPLPGRHLIDDHDDLEQIDAPDLLVELGFHLAVQAEGALRGGQDRLLQRLDQHGSVDVLVFGDLVEDQAEGGTVVHEALRWNSRSQSGTRLAFWMSSMGIS